MIFAKLKFTLFGDDRWHPAAKEAFQGGLRLFRRAWAQFGPTSSGVSVRAAIYARNGAPASIDRQIENARVYAERSGLEIVRSRESSPSGCFGSFEEMDRRAGAGEFGHLIVEDMDRLWRSPPATAQEDAAGRPAYGYYPSRGADGCTWPSSISANTSAAITSLFAAFSAPLAADAPEAVGPRRAALYTCGAGSGKAAVRSERARGYATAIGAQIVGSFSDPVDHDAPLFYRPEFLRLLSLAHERKCDLLIVEDSSQMELPGPLLLTSFLELEESRVEIHSAKHGLWPLLQARLALLQGISFEGPEKPGGESK
jgi:hypothetical protein